MYHHHNLDIKGERTTLSNSGHHLQDWIWFYFQFLKPVVRPELASVSATRFASLITCWSSIWSVWVMMWSGYLSWPLSASKHICFGRAWSGCLFESSSKLVSLCIEIPPSRIYILRLGQFPILGRETWLNCYSKLENPNCVRLSTPWGVAMIPFVGGAGSALAQCS